LVPNARRRSAGCDFSTGATRFSRRINRSTRPINSTNAIAPVAAFPETGALPIYEERAPLLADWLRVSMRSDGGTPTASAAEVKRQKVSGK